MSSLSRSRRAKPEAAPAPELSEIRLTIPDALLAWAREPDRQIPWPHPYGDEAVALVQAAQEAPLLPDATERLLSRLDAIVSAAIAAGRGDLCLGFDLQTAEWLGLHLRLDTERGPLHIGPTPQRHRLPPEDQGNAPWLWTYREVRVVFEAKERAAVDLAWKAKQAFADVFPGAFIADLEHERVAAPCVACGLPAGSIMMTTAAGFEYHYTCWSEMTAPMPAHLAKMLRRAPKALQR